MEKNYSIPNYVQELLLSSEDGLLAIINKLTSIINFPILVTDTMYQVLASTYDDEDECMINFEHHFIPSLQPSFFTCNWMINNESFETYGYTIVYKNERIGYIFLVNSERKDSIIIEDVQQLVDYAATLSAFRIKKKHELKKVQLKFKDSFLLSLIYGNIKEKAQILSFGSIWHWDFNKPHAVVVFSLDDYDHYSEDRQLLNPLQNLIEKKLVQLSLEPILLQKQSEIIALISINNEKALTQAKLLCEYVTEIIEAIKATSLAERISCGIGKLYNEPTDLFRSYQEAKVAYEIGLLLEVEIPYFGNIGLERILYKHDIQDLREFYKHTLRLLEEHDEENDGELMNNLEVLAFNQFDLTKTADELFLHRNTLRYRTKKIEEILDIKLDDMNSRLNIYAAFKIRQLHKDKL